MLTTSDDVIDGALRSWPLRTPSVVCDDVELFAAARLCDDVDLSDTCAGPRQASATAVASDCAYVAGDPINLKDPWGLSGTDGGVGTHECTNAAGKKQACWDEEPAPAAAPPATPSRTSTARGWPGECDDECRRLSKDERLARELERGLDLGFDVSANTPEARKAIDDAARHGVGVRLWRPGERKDLGASAKYSERENSIVINPRGDELIGRLISIFHELEHARQWRLGSSDLDLYRESPSREEFVRAYVLREVNAEATGRRITREILDANDVTYSSDPRVVHQLNLGAAPPEDWFASAYADMTAYHPGGTNWDRYAVRAEAVYNNLERGQEP